MIASTGFVTHPAAVVLAILVAATLGLTRKPILTAAMNEHIDDHDRATVLSTISMARMGGTGIVTLGLGIGMDHSIPITMILLGFGAAITALLTRMHGDDIRTAPTQHQRSTTAL